LTLRGYDLIFRSQQPGTGAHRCISAKNAPDLFLMGLLSAADALLDRPMKDILAELSLAPEICDALTGGHTPFTDV